MIQQPDLALALDRIAALNRELGRDPAGDPVFAAFRIGGTTALDEPEPEPPLEPLLAAARDLFSSLDGKLEKIVRCRTRLENAITRFAEIRDSQTNPLKRQEVQDVLDAEVAERQPEMDAYAAHEQALRAKMDRLASDPRSMFLPLGSVVRFTDNPGYVDSLSILQRSHDGELPAPGTVGVVTGLRHVGEFPVAVSVRRDFDCGDGTRFSPEYDRFPTYLVDPDKLEFLEPGMLPGDHPCESYGHVPTHGRTGTSVSADRDRTEMIVLADGFYWRLHDFGGSQAVEAIHAYETMEAMS